MLSFQFFFFLYNSQYILIHILKCVTAIMSVKNQGNYADVCKKDVQETEDIAGQKVTSLTGTFDTLLPLPDFIKRSVKYQRTPEYKEEQRLLKLKRQTDKGKL